MAATGYTPISLYYSTTASAAPTAGNLVAGELAINTNDGILYYKDSSGVVQKLATKGGVGTSSTTQVLYNNAGLISGASTFTFNGTTVTIANDASISGLTVGKGGGAVAGCTAVGLSALATNSTGIATTAVGAFAGNTYNTNGTENFGSTFLGVNAGRYTTTGHDNVYVGSSAGINFTTASFNTGVGAGALNGASSVSTGTNNTALGYTAGASNTTGAYNTSVGAQALYSNTTASNNTAVGYQAIYANTTGASNTALGVQSLHENTTGNYNIATGQGALYSNTTGSNNTAIGKDALIFNTTASNNTAVGYTALYSNTTGAVNTAVGTVALYSNTTGTNNVAVGAGAYGVTNGALTGNTTGSYNTAVGVSALALNTTASQNTAVGYQAGYSGNGASFASNVCVGYQSGYSTTSGTNTFLGTYAGYYVTSGAKNTIIGGYNGNQGGLDIRTANNYIVLSDGDGNPRITVDNNGGVGIGTVSPSAQGGYHLITAPGSVTTSGTVFLTMAGNATGTARSAYVGIADTGGQSGTNSALWVTKVGATGRSISAAGTINASGADYAEYMFKADDFIINKGDICGIDVNGKLTNVFADSISFVVKSTNPSYVGGDTWGAKSEKDGDDYTEEELEAQRQLVDRIAFSGQVPVNVIGATAGQYIIPTNDNGAIKGQAVSNPTFEQYQIAVGKVIAIEADGRAKIIVKVA